MLIYELRLKYRWVSVFGRIIFLAKLKVEKTYV